MNNRLPWLRDSGLAVLLGVALTFAFAPYGVYFLAVLSPLGLVALWAHTSPKKAFWLGFFFGIGFFGTGISWVYISIHYFGDVAVPLAMIITAGLVAILSFYPASVGYLLNRYFNDSLVTKVLFAFPVLWVMSEWVRSWLLSGFPWLFLGYSQTSSPLLGYAPLLSVYGISLLLLFSSALLFTSWYYYQQKNFRPLIFSFAALIIIWVSGSLLQMVNWTSEKQEPVNLSLVQGNIPQAIKWTPETLQLSFDRYQGLTETLWRKNNFVIWPESAIPMTLQNAADFIDALDKKAKETGTNLILGIPIEAADKTGYYNAIVSVGNDHKVYLKKHLVPFGEYVPFSKWLSDLFNIMNIPTSDLIPGSIKQQPFTIQGVKILPAICYEIAFPELMNTSDVKVGLILTLTNDAWFGRSSAQAQHLQMAMMRSAELRRPGIVVSNDGLTAIINAKGRVVSQAPPYEMFVLNGSIRPTFGLTPWMRFSMDPIFIILIVFLAINLREKWLIKKRTSIVKNVITPEMQNKS